MKVTYPRPASLGTPVREFRILLEKSPQGPQVSGGIERLIGRIEGEFVPNHPQFTRSGFAPYTPTTEQAEMAAKALKGLDLDEGHVDIATFGDDTTAVLEAGSLRPYMTRMLGEYSPPPGLSNL